MQFAYLRPFDKRIEGRDGFVLDVDPRWGDVSPASVAKARTLLSWYRQQQQLECQTNDGWLLYHRAGVEVTLDATTASGNANADIMAVLAVRDRVAAWGQPGLIMLRNTIEAQALMMDWLYSSQRWLDKNPAKRDELARHLAA